MNSTHGITTNLLAFVLSTYCCSHGQATQQVTALTRQQIAPVLIRNDRNRLQQIIVDVPEGPVFVSSLTFSLEGTDNLDDVDSLELLLPEADESNKNKAVARFGDRVLPADQIAFHGNVRLKQGANQFLLCCRLRPEAKLSHKVDAACVHIETSAGSIAPLDETPGVRKRIGVALRRHFDDGVHTYRIPALATTPQGTLLCVYDMRRRSSRDLQEDIDIGLLRSTDGGKSWEPQRVIMDMGEHGGLPEEQNGCSDPGIIVDPVTGDVMVSAVWTWGRPGTHQWSKGGSGPGYELDQSSQFLMVRSRDDGQTWSQPENLTRKLKKKAWILFAPSPQQGIALPDGVLVMPGQGRDEQDRSFSTLIVSRDHGQTWSVGNPASYNNSECQAVQLGDGSIMLNCRSRRGTGYRTVATTSDLGETWTPHATNRSALIEPGCNGSLYRLDYHADGGRKHLLAFANPHSQSARKNHTLQLSFDDGETWPQQYHLLLDQGVGRGYPSLSRVGDRRLGVVYEGSQAHLIFESFAIDELLARR